VPFTTVRVPYTAVRVPFTAVRMPFTAVRVPFTAVRVPFHTHFKIRVMLIIEGLTMTEQFGTSVKEELF
jgi:hypothetical protein